MMVWCGVPTLCMTNCSVLRASQRRGKSIFIPWRDSKLTRVLQVAHAHGDRFVDVHGHTSPERFVALQRALGTNARLRVIINISPADSSNSETVGSLLFGQRALTMTVAPVRVHGMPSVTCASHLGWGVVRLPDHQRDDGLQNHVHRVAETAGRAPGSPTPTKQVHSCATTCALPPPNPRRSHHTALQRDGGPLRGAQATECRPAGAG